MSMVGAPVAALSLVPSEREKCFALRERERYNACSLQRRSWLKDAE